MNVRRSAAWLAENDPDALLRYIRGVRALKARRRPGGTVSVYDEFVAVHKGVASLSFDAEFFLARGIDPDSIEGEATGQAAGGDGGHDNPGFLPWHRAYLRRLEVELQEVLDDPEATIPYWDWTDAEESKSVFTEDFLGSGGLGGEGPIPAGFFSPSGWAVRPDLQFFIVGSGVETLGSALVRRELDFTQLADQKEIDDLLLVGDYDDFRTRLEHGGRLHDHVHRWLGGSMAMMTSPNDPIFFLHHAFIDFVWARWQRTRREEWEADNPGQSYDLATHYAVPPGTPYGHGLDDLMWPWDMGRSTPAVFLPSANSIPVLQALFLTADAPVSAYSLGDRIRPRDVLDHEILGYTYEGL